MLINSGGIDGFFWISFCDSDDVLQCRFWGATISKHSCTSRNLVLARPEASLTHRSSLVTPPQRQPQGGGVPAGPDDGVDQDAPHVAEEELVGHGVAGVQDDLRQQVEEEHRRGQREGLRLVRAPDYATQDETEADEQGALWDDVGHMVVGLDD